MTVSNVINVRLLKHPMNWVIILLMLMIAGFAGHLALSYFGSEPAGSGLKSQRANAGLSGSLQQ